MSLFKKQQREQPIGEKADYQAVFFKESEEKTRAVRLSTSEKSITTG